MGGGLAPLPREKPSSSTKSTKRHRAETRTEPSTPEVAARIERESKELAQDQIKRDRENRRYLGYLLNNL